MSEELLEQLRDNGSLASQTAQVVARLLDTSALTEEHKARIRPAVESKQMELASLVDKLGSLERTDAIDEMMRAAAVIERLWDDISAKIDPPAQLSGDTTP